ncbi:MAG: zinc ribbon domain-containing protein [Lachnospiraceae bacterium]|nr:zinc ribbon domain-containing protein [Lachnospiraceae bacterium]
MRECRNCGEEVREGAKFCPHCGATQKTMTEEERDFANSAIGNFHMSDYTNSNSYSTYSGNLTAKGAIWTYYLKASAYLLAIIEFVVIVSSANKVNSFISEFSDNGFIVVLLGIIIGGIVSFTSLALFMVIISTVENIATSTKLLININKKLDNLCDKK